MYSLTVKQLYLRSTLSLNHRFSLQKSKIKITENRKCMIKKSL